MNPYSQEWYVRCRRRRHAPGKTHMHAPAEGLKNAAVVYTGERCGNKAHDCGCKLLNELRKGPGLVQTLHNTQRMNEVRIYASRQLRTAVSACFFASTAALTALSTNTLHCFISMSSDFPKSKRVATNSPCTGSNQTDQRGAGVREVKRTSIRTCTGMWPSRTENEESVGHKPATKGHSGDRKHAAAKSARFMLLLAFNAVIIVSKECWRARIQQDHNRSGWRGRQGEANSCAQNSTVALPRTFWAHRRCKTGFAAARRCGAAFPRSRPFSSVIRRWYLHFRAPR